MNTRKANLRKLQLPSAAKQQRTTRSTKVAAGTMSTEPTISNYFTTPKKANITKTLLQSDTRKLVDKACNLRSEQPGDVIVATSNIEHTDLTKIVLDNDTLAIAPHCLRPKKKLRESDLFESTADRPVKKAPKLKAGAKARPKRQIKIKSAFLRNEQLFSEITAQHCVADNFSPDEIELALAISKSETDTCCGSVYDDDDVVELISVQDKDKLEDNLNHNVRNKLKKYGFRTATKEDYNYFVYAAGCVTSENKRKKSKWANKFTALTLRNPELQLKKLNANIEKILAQQYKIKPLSAAECFMLPYTVLSAELIKLLPVPNEAIIANAENYSTADLAVYYVPNLFEISRVATGYLLKDWRSIQGRDISPERSTGANEHRRLRAQKMQQAYENLEQYYCNLYVRNKDNVAEKKIEPKHSATGQDQLLDSIKTSDKFDKSSSCQACAGEMIGNESTVATIGSSPIKEPPDKRSKLDVALTPSLSMSSSNVSSLFTTQSTRASSPDIFADSDQEMEDDAVRKFSLQVHKNITLEDVDDPHGVSIYEIYSSDEVKTPSNNGLCRENGPENDDPAYIIDLTQVENTVQNENKTEDLLESLLVDESGFLDSTIKSQNKPTGPKIKSDGNFFMDCNLQVSSMINYSDFLNLSIGEEISKSKKSITNRDSDLRIEDEAVNLRSLNNSPTQIKINAVFDELAEFSEIFNFKKINQKVKQSTAELNDLYKKYGLPQQVLRKEKSMSMDQINAAQGVRNCRKSSSFTLPLPEMSLELQRSFKDPKRSTGSNPIMCRKSASFNLSAERSEVRAGTRSITELTSSASIDLTQSDGDEDEDYLLLSDDEINYSIWRANKTQCRKSIDTKIGAVVGTRNDSILDILVENTGATSPKDTEKELLFHLYSDDESNVAPSSLERLEFGIIDAPSSEPFIFTQEQIPPPIEKIAWDDASFLEAAYEQANSKCYSSSNKFKELLEQLEPATLAQAEKAPEAFDEFDEFDQLVYGNSSAATKLQVKIPTGFEQLLTADINFNIQNVPEATKPTRTLIESEEVVVNGHAYSVRACKTAKPDFELFTEAEILKQLYNNGIKPLKRKQAIKMLEFIYNQTHPIMLNEEPQSHRNNTPNNDTPMRKTQSSVVSRSATALPSSQMWSKACSSNDIDYHNINKPIECANANFSADSKLNLRDATGDVLMRFSQELNAELTAETYILQTNITKKTPQPLLPFHIAWYNLLCANQLLHETVLMFTPIDLQEIYLYLKALGYRYDPKDLKNFFDKRCIIFRYDLTPPGKQAERHIRKPKKRTVKRI